MKIDAVKENQPVFHPITFTIRVESLAEYKSLYNLSKRSGFDGALILHHLQNAIEKLGAPK